MRKWNRTKAAAILALAAAAVLPARLFADDTAAGLADRVPADAVAYIGWSGSDNVKGFEQSHFKALLEALRPGEIFAQRADAANGTPEAEKAAAAREMAKDVITHPAALYIGPIEFPAGETPQPKIAIFSKMGAAPAAKWSEYLNKARDSSRHPDVPINAAVSGDFLVVTIGTVDAASWLAGAAPAENLGNSGEFKQTMAQVHGIDAPAVVYINTPNALEMLDRFIQARAGRGGFSQMWPAFKQGLGLNDLKQAAWAGSFDGADWVGELFIGMGEQRGGLLNLLDSAPLSDDTMKLIPKDVAWAEIFRFDANKFLDDLQAGLAGVPQIKRGLDMGLQRMYAFTGVDLQKDLLAPLGDEISIYNVADKDGSSLKNFVITDKLRDAPKMEASMGTLEQSINAFLQQMNPNGPQIKDEPLAGADKVTVHQYTFPGGTAPSWTITNNTMFFSFNSDSISKAVSVTDNITANPDFQALKARIGQGTFSSFVFIDLPKVAPEMYDMAKQALDQHKASNPDLKYDLPPLATLLPHLTPTLVLNWSDKDGFHAKAIGPFPFSAMLSPHSWVQGHLMGGAMRRPPMRRSQPAQPEPAPAPGAP